MAKYYAVRKGRKPGIYNSWDECSENVTGFKGAEFKSFKTPEEAEKYISGISCEKASGTSCETDNCDSKEKTGYRWIDEVRRNAEAKGIEIVAYVDGSYNTVTHEYGYGIYMIDAKSGEEKEFYGKGNHEGYVEMRNVAGEIMASAHTMKYALENNKKKIKIIYDYKGIECWCTGEWKTSKDATARYKRYYDKVSEDIEIIFEKVEGHSGNPGNDRADVLAKKGAGVE